VRVAAFDGLRGLCAVGVAAYHFAMWSGIAHVHSIGAYCVYIFFVLSSASMVIAYAGKLGVTITPFKFMLLRFARLWPLYAVVALYRTLTGGFDDPVGSLEALFLNITLLFGLATPGTLPVVTGGWSIGVECVFYLAFPLLLSISEHRRARVWLMGILISSQLVFIDHTLRGLSSTETSWSAYAHVLSFAGYFAAGLGIGWHVLERRSTWPAPVAWAAAVTLTAAIALGSAATSIDTLRGPRGVGLCLAAGGLVLAAAELTLPAALARLSTWLGDLSYALYLAHPVLYFLLSSRHVLGPMKVSHPALFASLALAASIAGAHALHVLVERPATRWLRARVLAT
jgi:peptidoglycan/LPS O-acetylase OafA/YrhL